MTSRECAGVREALPEHALGTLEPEGRRIVDRHLSWCAGCRREATELADGAALLGLVAVDPEPPRDLERRVRSVALAGPERRGRSRGSLIAAVVAAFLVVGVAGWGTVMAGRADRLEEAAGSARVEADRAARRFAQTVREVGGPRPVLEAVLRPETVRQGGGRAVLYDADVSGTSDWVLVLAGGLPERRGPYRAHLLSDDGRLPLGRMRPGKVGQLAVYGLFPAETHGYEQVVIVDARDRVVMEGRFTKAMVGDGS